MSLRGVEFAEQSGTDSNLKHPKLIQLCLIPDLTTNLCLLFRFIVTRSSMKPLQKLRFNKILTKFLELIIREVYTNRK